MDSLKLDRFMELAMREAEQAFQKGEVPVGAVVVFEDRVVGRGHNQTESLHDATAHAEMIALSAAYGHFGDWRLENCYLFSTLEPCAMCAGAAMLSRISTIVYGASDPKFGACGSILDIPNEQRLNHKIEVVSGIKSDDIAAMMKLFFQQVRSGRARAN
jgi:tRNA(adenine34) deaminase